MLDEAHHVAGVAVLVVVPGHDLDEGGIESDTGIGVEDRRHGAAAIVGGDHLVFGIAEHALERAFGSGLHRRADVGVAGFLVQLDGQVDHRDVRRGHAEGHAGELFVQLGNDFAHRLGRAGARRDDVVQDAPAAAPVFARRAVHGLLRGGGGVHRTHQAALDAEAVVEHLGHGGQAVGGAGGGGDDFLASVLGVVHAIDEHRRVVLGGGGLHHFLGASVDVLLAGIEGEEEAGGFNHHVGIHFVPLQVGGIALGGEADFLAVDHQVVAFHAHRAVEAAMHRVVLQHVSQVVRLEQVVDGDDLQVFELGFLRHGAEHHAADAAESIDGDANGHMRSPE